MPQEETACARTPIFEFLTRYEKSGISRLHMPGHKGQPALPEGSYDRLPFSLDITEIGGADVLYEATGIIGESEEIAASLYGAGATCYSTGGSTLSILAMLGAAKKKRGGGLLAVRNAHIALINACALLDWQPRWLFPEYDPSDGLCGAVTPGEIAAAMDATEGMASIGVVYLTSPDYYGRMADIKGIAQEVHKRGALLLVDNAHGAHLRFLREDRHPITLGADFCSDSAHKTLPVLTGGSYLHMRDQADKPLCKEMTALFGSTSPSYLILASLDLCNRYLALKAREELAALETRVALLEETLRRMGIPLLSNKSDPLKLVVDCKKLGVDSDEARALLRSCFVEPEFCGSGKLILMVSPQTSERDFDRLIGCFAAFPKRSTSAEGSSRLYEREYAVPKQVMGLRDAMFAPSESVDVDDAGGRIAAESRVTCPPAIPVVVAGEQIGGEQKILLKNSGIFSLKVVK